MNRQRNLSPTLRSIAPIFAILLAFALAACSPGDTDQTAADQSVDKAAETTEITLYSGQHESLAKALADGFERDTGIQVRLRAGKDGALANQIIEEGQRSRADVFITEEPGPMGDLARRGLLTPVPEDILAKSAQRFVPAGGSWLPWAARSRVFYFNPELIDEADLPESILDLTRPEWKGRFAYAPSGAFRSTTAYLINTIGADATLDWLKGIRENGINEQKNGKVRDSVEAGQHEFGLSNHYYWYIMTRNSDHPEDIVSRVHFLNNEDAGALMLASGAGVLASSSKQTEAMQFLDWLVAAEGGQKVVAESSPQFPVNSNVDSVYDLPAINTLTFPEFDQAELDNVDEASDLLKQAGII
ncbi:MAG TPA: extracellular solute-binding protein [Wenzhouxiangella sp.]|nr:extracellular solute-binding protein [Wenzhouxiangella sp.]